MLKVQHFPLACKNFIILRHIVLVSSTKLDFDLKTNTSKRHQSIVLICIGKTVSSASTSLEKRAKILPLGVVSKKLRALLNIPTSISLWSLLAAPRAPKSGKRSAKNEKNPKHRNILLKFALCVVL